MSGVVFANLHTFNVYVLANKLCPIFLNKNITVTH